MRREEFKTKMLDHGLTSNTAHSYAYLVERIEKHTGIYVYGERPETLSDLIQSLDTGGKYSDLGAMGNRTGINSVKKYCELWEGEPVEVVEDEECIEEEVEREIEEKADKNPKVKPVENRIQEARHEFGKHESEYVMSLRHEYGEPFLNPKEIYYFMMARFRENDSDENQYALTRAGVIRDAKNAWSHPREDFVEGNIARMMVGSMYIRHWVKEIDNKNNNK